VNNYFGHQHVKAFSDSLVSKFKQRCKTNRIKNAV